MPTKIARAKSDIRLVASALDRYYADTGDDSLKDNLNNFCSEKLTEPVDLSSGDKVGPYLKTCPASPWEGTNYNVSWDDSTLSYNIDITFTDNKCISSKDLSKVYDSCPINE